MDIPPILHLSGSPSLSLFLPLRFILSLHLASLPSTWSVFPNLSTLYSHFSVPAPPPQLSPAPLPLFPSLPPTLSISPRLSVSPISSLPHLSTSPSSSLLPSSQPRPSRLSPVCLHHLPISLPTLTPHLTPPPALAASLGPPSSLPHPHPPLAPLISVLVLISLPNAFNSPPPPPDTL